MTTAHYIMELNAYHKYMLALNYRSYLIERIGQDFPELKIGLWKATEKINRKQYRYLLALGFNKAPEYREKLKELLNI